MHLSFLFVACSDLFPYGNMVFRIQRLTMLFAGMQIQKNLCVNLLSRRKTVVFFVVVFLRVCDSI